MSVFSLFFKPKNPNFGHFFVKFYPRERLPVHPLAGGEPRDENTRKKQPFGGSLKASPALSSAYAYSTKSKGHPKAPLLPSQSRRQ